MPTPNEAVVAQALVMLGEAESVADVAAGCGALIAGLGMRRYVVVDIRHWIVAGLYHNVPKAAQDDLLSMDAQADDPVMVRARRVLTPFTWSSAEGGHARAKHAELGFRSGVTAGSWDEAGSGCVLILSDSAEVPAERERALLRDGLMASVLLAQPIKQLLPNALTPCPLTDRELDCLAYSMAGKSAKETASSLSIGIRTVHQYLMRARDRLGVDSSMAAAVFAMRHGWLDMRRVHEIADLEAGSRDVGVSGG